MATSRLSSCSRQELTNGSDRNKELPVRRLSSLACVVPVDAALCAAHRVVPVESWWSLSANDGERCDRRSHAVLRARAQIGPVAAVKNPLSKLFRNCLKTEIESLKRLSSRSSFSLYGY